MMELQNSGISVDDGGNLNNVNVKDEDSVPMSSSSRPMEGLRSAGPAPFLTKTYDMVEDSLTNTVVSWSRTNNSFIVWNSHQFSTDLLPQYFKHNNFSSFVRQLHTYGFRKVDPDRWEFANEGFLRGEKHLLNSIQRRKRSCPSQFLDHHHQQGQGIGACVEVGRIGMVGEIEELKRDKSVLMKEVVKLRQQQQSTGNQLQNIGHRLQASEQRQQHLITFLARAIQNPTFLAQLSQKKQATKCIDTGKKKRRLPKGEVEQERRSPSPSKGGIVKNQANTSILSDADQTQNSTILEALLSIMGHADSPDMPTPHETFQDESMSIKSMETTSTFDRDSIHLDRAEGEDQDLKAVNDVFWEDLLNEQFDSGTEADADFYPSRSGVSLLVQQMGQTAFHQSIPITSEKCSSA